MNRYASLWPALVIALTASVAIAVLRYYPLQWNLASVGALALFAGARLRSWWALTLPLGLMLATDYWLSVARPENPFLHPDTAFVYGSYALVFVAGRLFGKTENVLQLAALGFFGSVLFFLVTNLGVWLNVVVLGTVPMESAFAGYDNGLSGLLLCYEKALPFYRGTLAGDLIFTAVLFGAHAVLTRVAAQPSVAASEVS